MPALPAPQDVAEERETLSAPPSVPSDGLTSAPVRKRSNRFALNVLWMDKQIGVAVDQLFSVRCLGGGLAGRVKRPMGSMYIGCMTLQRARTCFMLTSLVHLGLLNDILT